MASQSLDPFELSSFVRDFMNFMIKNSRKLDCYRMMWLPDSNDKDFFDFCNFVRNQMKKANLPDVLKEEKHLTILCEQLSRLLGRQGVSFKNRHYQLFAHISVPDSKYHCTVFMLEGPSFLFDLEEMRKNQHSSRKLEGGGNIFEVMRSHPISAIGASSKRKREGEQEKEASPVSKKIRKHEDSNDEDEQQKETSPASKKDCEKHRNAEDDEQKAEVPSTSRENVNSDDWNGESVKTSCLKKSQAAAAGLKPKK